jgi:hypothetical protein
MRKLWCLMLGVMVGLLAVSTAQAQTSVNEVVSALKKNRVYVAPGTENVDQYTASELEAQLTGGDNIVLVMLPENGGESPEAMAQAIDKATGHKYIVGLSVGSTLTAASTIMPNATARNLMERAVDTGTNPTERLGTFARNVHEWQAEHPDEPAAKKPSKSSGGAAIFVFIAALIALACAAGAIFLSRRKSPDDSQDIKFKASPDPVRDVLRKIQHLAPQVKSPDMRESVVQAVADTEAYFKRNSESQKKDAGIFVTHLTSVKDVLERYIDIQENPRYYDNPEKYLKKGREGVEGFGEFVIDSIRAGRKRDLTQFNVDTDILSAQRYR